MADERTLSISIEPHIDPLPFEELKTKQEEAQEDAQETAESFDKIGTRITDIGTRARSSFNRVMGSSVSLGSTVRTQMLNSIKSGNSLGTAIKAGVGGALTFVGTKAKAFGVSVKTVAKGVGDALKHPIKTIKGELADALEDAGKGAKDAGDKAVKAGNDFDRMGKQGKGTADTLISKFKGVVAAIAALAIISQGIGLLKDLGGEAIAAAANAEEMRSKFEVVFKDTASGAGVWAENFASAAKRSKNEVMGMMADSQALFTGLGMDTGGASDMSKMMTSLAYDLASFNNIADQDAFDKIQSGITGETSGLKSLGIVLNEAALAQSMFNMGLKGTFNDLDEATKAQVRFDAILAQTANAQTDVVRTTDSYTNGLKGIQGVWQDFLSDAGAKFTPILTNLFNVILEAWPRIEPLLMGLADMLAGALSENMPMLIDLGMELLPLLADTLGTVISAAKPLLPVFISMAKTILPPLIGIIAMLAQTVLPPLVDIFNTLNTSVLQPLLPVFMKLIDTLLPPLTSLLSSIAPILTMLTPVISMLGQMLLPIVSILGEFISSLLPPLMGILDTLLNSVIMPLMPILMSLCETLLPPIVTLLGMVAPLLEAITPVLTLLTPIIEAAGAVLGWVAELLAKIIGWVADGVGKVADFFSDLFGGTKKAAEGTDGLADSMRGLNSATDNYKPPEIPDPKPVQMPPISAPSTKEVDKSLKAVGSEANTTFASAANASEKAWQSMSDASRSGADRVISDFDRIKKASDAIGTITVGTRSFGGRDIPHNAKGTDDFEGGPTYINEEGGEIAVLPGGTKIIPADKSEKLIANTSNKKSSRVFAPLINITMPSGASKQEKDSLKAELTALVTELLKKDKDDSAEEDALQEALPVPV